MKHLNEKYYKRAIRVLCMSPFVKEYKLTKYTDLVAFISELETRIEERKNLLDYIIDGLPTAKSNVEILKNGIAELKEQIEKDGLRTKTVNEIKERITEHEYNLQELEDAIIEANALKSKLPTEIANIQDALEQYLYKVEPQMRIERMKELNKGRKIEYFC